jgi:phosphoribosylglycinamide formyltransferase-1
MTALGDSKADAHSPGVWTSVPSKAVSVEKGSDPLIAVLISGRGSNLQALIQAADAGRLHARIVLVISNVEGVEGIAHAERAGIETLVIPHRQFAARAEFDRALVDALRSKNVALVCLAGFMRRLGPDFCRAFPNAILNIHPSLLPAFPGVDAQRQALEHGVKLTGATVHFVTPELDAGPIVLQRAVPVLDNDSAATLAARVLAVEHAIYPEAVQRVLNGQWRIVGRRVVFEDGPGG